jgi:3-dehydroquinate synthase
MSIVESGALESQIATTCISTRTSAYPIHVVQSVDEALQLLAARVRGRPVWIVTDTEVAYWHGRTLIDFLRKRSVPIHSTSLAPGEASKSLDSVRAIMDWMSATGFSRRDTLVAFGGGMVVDTTGLVASIYMRGVPYLNLATTLLAQVDAAIGGKVGVDHGSAKNLIGSFYEPQAVISCTEYLSSLDSRELRCGLAEVIKKAVIASPRLFDYLENHLGQIIGGSTSVLYEVVRSASILKAALIEADPYESDLRRPLNFGHTVGHAVETATGYGPVRHGEAVAFGIAVAVDIALRRGVIGPVDASRITRLLAASGLPVRIDALAATPRTDNLVAALDKIRQVRAGSLRFVLPAAIGATEIVDDVTSAEIVAAMTRGAR